MIRTKKNTLTETIKNWEQNEERILTNVPIVKKVGIIGKIPIIGNFIGKNNEIEKHEEFKELEKTINTNKATREDILAEMNRTQDKIFKEKNIQELKQPILILTRYSMKAEMFEDQRPGVFEFKRSDGKLANLYLPSAKLQSLRIGDKELKLWYAYEGEAIALPNNPILDSHTVLQVLATVIANKDDLKIKELHGYDSIFWTIGTIIIIIAIILFIVAPTLHINALGMIQDFLKPTTPIVQQAIQDTNVIIAK